MFFSIAAGILATMFYLAYFYKQIRLKQKGIRTNHMGKGSKPRRTALVEQCLMMATYASAVLQYASLFFSTHLFPLYFPASVRFTGVLLASAGVFFFIGAITVMEDSWRAGIDNSQPTAMITAGLYQFSRNPAFVGFDLLYLGFFLATSNLLLFVFLVITIGLLHLQILEEEKFLPQVFGEQYMQYRAVTPRYLFFQF